MTISVPASTPVQVASSVNADMSQIRTKDDTIVAPSGGASSGPCTWSFHSFTYCILHFLINIVVYTVADYTKIPKQMERKFEELDTDSMLRPTIIKAGNTWKKLSQKSLLAKAETVSLATYAQEKERNKVLGHRLRD